jgi:hypothetical protein
MTRISFYQALARLPLNYLHKKKTVCRIAVRRYAL